MIQASVANNSKTSRQESQSCLSGLAPMTCVFAHRTTTLGDVSPRKAAATRSKLGFALLLAGAVLTMGAILGLKLNADWIVLSACNTAAAEGKGAEAVSGLGRAFFYAGARALLVSNWPVETTSAKALTTDLFKRQAKDPTLTRAEALQQAMLALIDGPGRTDAQGKTLFSYAHPIFWAPFSLVGDGSGAAQ